VNTGSESILDIDTSYSLWKIDNPDTFVKVVMGFVLVMFVLATFASLCALLIFFKGISFASGPELLASKLAQYSNWIISLCSTISAIVWIFYVQNTLSER